MIKDNIKFELDKGYIKKSPVNNGASLEIASSISAYSLAKRSGLFSVPEVLEFDLEANEIVFEYIQNISPVGSLLHHLGDEKLAEIFFRVGQILRYIHLSLEPDCGRYLIPKSIDFEGWKTFLHGDFNLINVQYDLLRDHIVILDWSLTPLLKKSANWGTHFWDIAWMINSIFCSPPYLTNDYLYRKMLAESFLLGYQQNSSNVIDKKAFSLYCQNVFELFLKKFQQRTDFLHQIVQLPNRFMFEKFSLSLGKEVNSLLCK
ncbi:hypothetical protein ADN00_09320 [Ornatilinea apprima]|uniref:Aminoglycoside phosphotransferase domain-containing protein n=1 Tax=Ornatilinea apprima TaxID=1134406 RepID=A0A0P6X5V6_9CHLR|nr:hypothetical protein [Ornatilinea apprima]KPL77317.1 hypothetical protein ADN00_09320 [Ornatilinea apprima]